MASISESKIGEASSSTCNRQRQATNGTNVGQHAFLPQQQSRKKPATRVGKLKGPRPVSAVKNFHFLCIIFVLLIVGVAVYRLQSVQLQLKSMLQRTAMNITKLPAKINGDRLMSGTLPDSPEQHHDDRKSGGAEHLFQEIEHNKSTQQRLDERKGKISSVKRAVTGGHELAGENDFLQNQQTADNQAEYEEDEEDEFTVPPPPGVDCSTNPHFTVTDRRIMTPEFLHDQRLKAIKVGKKYSNTWGEEYDAINLVTRTNNNNENRASATQDDVFGHMSQMRSKIDSKNDEARDEHRVTSQLSRIECPESTPECDFFYCLGIDHELAEKGYRKCCIEHTYLKRTAHYVIDTLERVTDAREGSSTSTAPNVQEYQAAAAGRNSFKNNSVGRYSTATGEAFAVIPYFLSTGSALGAIRHGGVIIPWDTDVDMAVPRHNKSMLQVLFSSSSSASSRFEQRQIDASSKDSSSVNPVESTTTKPHYWTHDPMGREVDWVYYRADKPVKRLDAEGPHVELFYEEHYTEPAAFPAQRCSFYGKQTWCPNEAMFVKWFGRNWRAYSGAHFHNPGKCVIHTAEGRQRSRNCSDAEAIHAKMDHKQREAAKASEQHQQGHHKKNKHKGHKKKKQKEH